MTKEQFLKLKPGDKIIFKGPDVNEMWLNVIGILKEKTNVIDQWIVDLPNGINDNIYMNVKEKKTTTLDLSDLDYCELYKQGKSHLPRWF